jgi:hypothetical protein
MVAIHQNNVCSHGSYLVSFWVSIGPAVLVVVPFSPLWVLVMPIAVGDAYQISLSLVCNDTTLVVGD